MVTSVGAVLTTVVITTLLVVNPRIHYPWVRGDPGVSFRVFFFKVAWNFILVLYVFLKEPFLSIFIDMVCKNNVLVRNCMHYNSHRYNVFATRKEHP